MASSLAQNLRAEAYGLEQDAARYPDERGEILLEAAEQWERAGELDRAVALCYEVLAVGGEDAGYARFRLAQLCFDHDADDEAWAHLDALDQTEPPGSGRAELVAELLEERGDYQAALGWFDRAIGPGEVARMLADPNAGDLGTAISLFGRQRCRNRLGLDGDELDHAADVAEARRREWATTLERRGWGRSGETTPHAPRPEMLVWPRGELARANERWPQVFTSDTAAQCADVERRLAELAAEKHTKTITLITGSADGLEQYLQATGGDPADESVRLAYAAQARELGRTSSWPPGRNQQCWCGSARKYKKCCGVPGRS